MGSVKYSLGSGDSSGVNMGSGWKPSKRLKQANVAPSKVIYIDDGDDEVEVLTKDEVVYKGSSKGKSIKMGSNNNSASGIKVLRQLNIQIELCYRSVGKKNPAYTSSVLSRKLSSSKEIEDDEIELMLQLPAMKKSAPVSSSRVRGTSGAKVKAEEVEDEVLKKFRVFKHFDGVHGCSDHHYFKEGSKSKQASPKWLKVIGDEWNILKKDLPDTIFVRAYEDRMDLLRAVIIGAAGTPYQDGLFFFDVFFPPQYPNTPPKVHYHAHGERLNPNLYNCGKVCLSLLNTWQGAKNEKWTPGLSTMLQVLLSIQALVLNAKPFFNEPGYVCMAGQPEGEKRSRDYNEQSFILSCKTMLTTLKRPPKHFEDFVIGYFRKHAHVILLACKAYSEGVQVGSLAKGGVQDVDEEGIASGSEAFKMQVNSMIMLLVEAFTRNGATDCQQFLPLPAK